METNLIFPFDNWLFYSIVLSLQRILRKMLLYNWRECYGSWSTY